jgi:transketolase
MSEAVLKTMRDVLIDEIYARMCSDERIYFLAADFGAPSLDKVRERFPDRFLSVGIAEQNLIGVSAGLALEGCTVFSYGIAPFMSMRDCEQLKIDLSLLSQTRDINVNLMSVGAGVSYDVSGPTHHCLEDISIIRTLPNFDLFSPSDWVMAKAFVDYSLRQVKPKYMRLDSQKLPSLYSDEDTIDFDAGFHELMNGQDVCLVATGYATHKALEIAASFRDKGSPIGVVDVFMLKPIDTSPLAKTLAQYRHIISMEEAFVGKGGLDSLVLNVVNDHIIKASVKTFGFRDTYLLDNGDRDSLGKLYGLDPTKISCTVSEYLSPTGRATAATA